MIFTGKKWVTACFSLIFLVLLMNGPSITHAQELNEAHVYCFPGSSSSELVFDFFESETEWKVVLHDLDKPASLDGFLTIIKTLSLFGVSVTPPDLCLMCKLRHLSWEDILVIYDSPLVGFFRSERLTAITIGISDHETLNEAQAVNDDDVKVFTSYDVSSIGNARVQLQELFLSEKTETTEINILSLALSITLLAFADSVNPCTFALFSALLLLTLHSSGEKRAIISSFSFISAIFVGYYVLGIGVFRALIAVPHINEVLVIVGLILGIFSIIRGLRVEFRSPIPKSFRKLIELRIEKYHASVAASFVLGVFAAFALLPCSGGPYVVSLGLLSTLEDSVQTYLLLGLYNLIFVVPLVLILTTILAFRGMSHKIKILRSKKLGVMELISGVLLVTICIYLLSL